MTKEKEKRDCRPPHLLSRERLHVRGRQEVHHHLVTYVHGKQLGYLHMPTCARLPARRQLYFFPELLLVIFPQAAVAEEMLPRLGRRTSAPPALSYTRCLKRFR